MTNVYKGVAVAWSEYRVAGIAAWVRFLPREEYLVFMRKTS